MQSILIVGYGAMASAMLEGWLKAGYDPARFTIYNPRPKAVPDGIKMVTQWPDAQFDAVVLAMKPHQLDLVADDAAARLHADSVLISVLAGVKLAQYRALFPNAGGWCRLMPNLACALGQSANLLVAQGLSASARGEIDALAKALGTAEWLPDEDHFNLATALAGSGPGFVYRFIDALSHGAAQLGLDGDMAQRLAVQMVAGAGAVAAKADVSAGELADRVASPGGMTREGLNVLDADDALQSLLTACLRATGERGDAMGKD